MKIETISVMQRKNLGNYEHLEISATAKIEEGEEAFSSILSLKTILQAALEAKAEEKQKEVTQVSEPVKEETKIEETPVAEEKPKAKRGPKPKAKVEDNFNGQDIPPVIPAEAKAPKAIPYNRSLDTHKNMLSAYLSNTFPGWKACVKKSKEETVAFTASLEGKPFLDESGEIIESFKAELNAFFA